MSSRFLKDVQGIYFAGDGGVGVGASSTLRRRFQCSPAMATCDGMYTESRIEAKGEAKGKVEDDDDFEKL